MPRRRAHDRLRRRGSSGLRFGAQNWLGPFLAPVRCATILLLHFTDGHHFQKPLPPSAAVRSLCSALRTFSARCETALCLRCTLPAQIQLRLAEDDAVAKMLLPRFLRVVPTPPLLSRRVGPPPLAFPRHLRRSSRLLAY
ncbi:hypothetical protein XENOCAPTIV_027931, partial [Xenoophorus captivus]